MSKKKTEGAPERGGRASARRVALMEAAAQLFLTQGYGRTSLRQIIERSGGSRSTVYEQFGDKAGLFRIVVLQLCEEMFAPLAHGLADHEREPASTLQSVESQFLDVLWGRDVQALSRIVYAEGGRSPEIADVFFEAGYEEGYRQLANYLGHIAPTITGPKRLSLARMFLTMLPGDAYDRLLAGASVQRTQAELDAQIAFSVEWLLWKLGLD